MDKNLTSDERNFIRNERIKEVLALLVLGKYRTEINDILQTKWGVGSDAMDKYVMDARALMKSHFSEQEIADIFAKYNYLYQDALLSGDKKLAVKILDSISKLGGFSKEKIDVTTNGESINQTIINIINPNGDNSNTK